LEKSAAPSNRALLAGLWSLTAQSKAITLEDVTKKLHVDPRSYKVEGGRIYYNLSALNEDQTSDRANVPIRAITLWAPALVAGANQELRIRFSDAVCVSTASMSPYADSPVMTEQVPCTDGAACSSEMTYFWVPGQNRTDKRLAIGSQLRVARECSQGVVIAKTFDKDYWLALCPFNYSKQVHDSVIADVKKKYADIYASLDLEQPQITDYGGPTMRLNFREPASAPRLALLSMEVDRCDQTVIRSWLPPQPK
ncbi:MAG: hypothetical protein M3Y27_32340, partial [Acidobacteriota bacterium]|nr:hypothetical protein [Acidobacteriota bacterium]